MIKNKYIPVVVSVFIVIVISVFVISASISRSKETKTNFFDFVVRKRSHTDKNTESRTIDIGGVERSYLIHYPENYEQMNSLKLLMVLHGGGGSAEEVSSNYGWNEVAERYNFLVVYPDGIDNNWNDGRVDNSLKGNPLGDDVGFLGKVIDQVIQNNKVDSSNVFVTGISNGGFMSFKLACELRDKITAVAPVVASVPIQYKQTCNPDRGIHIIWFNGTEDPILPWNGGGMKPTVLGVTRDRGEVLSADEAIQFWRQKNNCNEEVKKTELEDLNKRDNSTVTRLMYCESSKYPIDFYQVNGGGHSWPGGPQYLPKFIIGNVNQDIDSLDLIGSFFDSITV